MGGDHGPSVTVPASLAVLAKHAKLHLILVGDTEKLQSELSQHHFDTNRLHIQHASQVVKWMSHLTRTAFQKDSSMRVAINWRKKIKRKHA